MYINEVIRRCDTLAPNEYTLEEKYAYCDELSAMLCQEYMKKYSKVILEPDENGEYLLPEGVTFEMVDKVVAQGREIEKYDFRSFGIMPLYGLHERFYIPEHCQRHGNIEVIYLSQYESIRTVNTTGTLDCVSGELYDFGEYNVSTRTSENEFSYYLSTGTPSVGDTVMFSVSEDCSSVALPYSPQSQLNPRIEITYDFKQGGIYYAVVTKGYSYTSGTIGPKTHYTVTENAKGEIAKFYIILDSSRLIGGDTVKLTYGNDSTTTATVAGVEQTGTNKYKVYINEELFISRDISCTIERVVTDETVCPAPYDVMYVDFLIAQIAKGQRNYPVYNQHMNVFNQKLSAYHNWLMDRKTQVKDNKMRNWW